MLMGLKKGLGLLGLKKGLRKGEGSDNFLSSGGGAVHLKVSQRFPVLATLAHPQLGQTLVQTSKEHTGFAHLELQIISRQKFGRMLFLTS